MAKVIKTGRILLVMILFMAWQVYCLPTPALAETVSIPDGAIFIEHAKELNGQEVVFQGEIIGEIMPRQDHFWINVLSNGTAIGIWITAEQRSMISSVGRYESKGDTVSIIGTFNQACSEHGGDLDIHASSLEVIERGHMMPESLNMPHLAAAIGLLLLAIISLLFFCRSYRHNKRE